MKILYINGDFNAAFKAFTNYINTKQANINFELLDIAKELYSRWEYTVKLNDKNRYLSFWGLFFIDSFIKNNYSFKNLEKDYEIVKSDLPFNINFEKFYEVISIADKLVEEINIKNPDYLFVRYFEIRNVILYYTLYKLKQKNKNIKIIMGNEKKIPPIFEKMFFDEKICDHFFCGYGENMIDLILNDELKNKPLYITDFSFNDEKWCSFNNKISSLDLKTSNYNFYLDMLCPYNCTFCDHAYEKLRQNPDIIIDEEKISYMANKIKYFHKLFPKMKFDCTTSLLIINPKLFTKFFEYLLPIKDTVNLNGMPITVGNYLNNFDLLNQFKKSYFFLGAEHNNQHILNLMNKKYLFKDLEKILKHPKRYNLIMTLMYNFFGETKDHFDEWIAFANWCISKKYIISLNLFNMTYKEFDNHTLGFEYKEPVVYKKYFNRTENDLFFEYVNLHDPDNSLVLYKNETVHKNFETITNLADGKYTGILYP